MSKVTKKQKKLQELLADYTQPVSGREALTKLQNEGNHTEILYLQEIIKTLPWEEVYEEYLKETGCLNESEWFEKVKEYEKEVMAKRGE